MSLNLLELLQQERLLAIVRGDDVRSLADAAQVLVEEGVRLVEFSLSGSASLEALERAKTKIRGDVTFGVGTVLTARDAEHAHQSGAEFIVTPAVCEGIGRAQELGMPVLAGAFTPTEVANALATGADAIKIFPASLGGPSYLRDLHGPFPEAQLVAVGGVARDDVQKYLNAGAIAVGVGSPLLGDAAGGGDLEQLRQRTRDFVSAAGVKR